MAEVAIQGAGIAGCALALLLARQGHSVTVLERTQFLRSGGQAVDVRGVALKVVKELKLIEEVRACRTRPVKAALSIIRSCESCDYS